MPRFSFYAALLLAASLSFLTPGTASATTTCTASSQDFFGRDIDLCIKNIERIDCRSYCNHLPSRITEMSGSFQAMEEYRPEKHAEWQQCYQEYQLPCENRRDHKLNKCLIDAQARFHATWLECPDAKTALPPLIPTRLHRN